MSGSSLSDSSYSVSSDAPQGGLALPVRPLKLWEQTPPSVDNSDILWSEGAVQPKQPALQKKREDGEPAEGTPGSGELNSRSVAFKAIHVKKAFSAVRVHESLRII